MSATLTHPSAWPGYTPLLRHHLLALHREQSSLHTSFGEEAGLEVPDIPRSLSWGHCAVCTSTWIVGRGHNGSPQEQSRSSRHHQLLLSGQQIGHIVDSLGINNIDCFTVTDLAPIKNL